MIWPGPESMVPSPSAKLSEQPTLGHSVLISWYVLPPCGVSYPESTLGYSHLHGDRQNEYDGEDEFWVTVKESGKKTESTSYEELHQKESEAITFL